MQAREMHKNKANSTRPYFSLKSSYANKKDKGFPNHFPRQSFPEVRAYKY